VTSPLLSRPGAVAADAPDAGVALHYGDPHAEQRRAETGAVVVDRSSRDVLRVGGADRLGWLHSLTTQHLSALPPWTPTEALVLDPHGRVEHLMQVVDDGESTWLDVEPGTAPALLQFLDRMRFLLRVEPADVTADWAVLSVVGPESAAVVQRALGAAPAGSGAAPLPAGGFVRTMSWPLPGSVDLLLPRASLDGCADALLAAGATLSGLWAFEALRVAARKPRLGRETDHKTIPHEVGLLPTAVHLDKGCYRGQETVARVHNLGRPPRRLVLLHLDGSDDQLPAPGDPVTLDGRAVGFVGTPARHHELGPVALAVVKRNTADDAALVAGEQAARIEPAQD
jgi:tRNA-modifying protein YgfZ